MRRTTWMLALVAVSGCELPLGLSEDAVEASLTSGGVRVENHLDEVVHYFVNDPRSLILWAPCTRVDCPSLGPNESVVVPYASIPGYSEETGRIEVHWWERGAGRDGLAPVEAIHTIRLDR